MLTVLGFDQYGNARAIEVEGSRDEVELILKAQGWKNLIVIED